MKKIKISKKISFENSNEAKLGDYYIFSDYDVSDFEDLLRYSFFSKLDRIIDEDLCFYSREKDTRFRYLYEISIDN